MTLNVICFLAVALFNRHECPVPEFVVSDTLPPGPSPASARTSSASADS